MPLPILNPPKTVRDADLVRFYHRTERLWTEEIADAKELNGGTAFFNPQRIEVAAANRMLDATIPQGATAVEVIDEVDRHFAGVGCRCASWVMNPSSAPEQTQPLVDQLLASGYRAELAAIMHLPRATTSPANAESSLRFIPARAGFRHARLLADEATGNHAALTDALMAHLDDPHWDAILALKGNSVAGTAGVLIAGEIGRLDQLYVSEKFREQGVATQLIARVLQTCARSLLKQVMLGVSDDNTPALMLFQKFGFVRVGSLTVYRAATV